MPVGALAVSELKALLEVPQEHWHGGLWAADPATHLDLAAQAPVAGQP